MCGYILLKVDFLNSKVKTEEVMKIIRDNHFRLSKDYNSKIKIIRGKTQSPEVERDLENKINEFMFDNIIIQYITKY